MSTSPSPVTPPVRSSASSASARASRALLALALLSIAGRAAGQAPGAAQDPVADKGPIAAVWKKEEILFSYHSAIAFYSCDSLRDRVASILFAVGARPDLEIKVTNCSQSVVPMDAPTVDRASRTWEPGIGTIPPRPVDRQQVSTVHVLLSMPVEMTPETMEDLKADKSRRELISRVTGNPIPRFDDPIPFAAERRVVTISYQTVGIEAAECELLDQLVTSSFKNLGLRVAGRGYSCDPRRVSHIRPKLDVEALVPVQFEQRDSRQKPSESGDEPETGAPATSDEAPSAPATDKPPE